MATTVSLREEKKELIQGIRELDDVDLVRKMKKYFARITKSKLDPMYSEANLRVLNQALQDYREGRCKAYTMEEIHQMCAI